MKRCPIASGIYFLYMGKECVYIGCSINMCARVLYHNHKGKFDRVEWILFPEEWLLHAERVAIAMFNPPLNKIGNRGRVYTSYKTHCIHGHERTGMTSDGRRYCETCVSLGAAKRNAKMRELWIASLEKQE